MRRVLPLILGATSLALAFLVVLARAHVETRFYAQVGGLALGALVGGVLITALFSYAHIALFDAFGGPLRERFAAFMGWRLLRHMHTRPTVGSKLRAAIARLRATSRRHSAGRLALGAVALSAGLLATHEPALWNALADAVSPAFARTAVLGVDLLGAAALALGLAGLALHRPGATARVVLVSRPRLSVQPFVAIVGVALGVWALILALSVMHGFAGDLRAKILRTNAHVVVQPKDAAGTLGDGLALADALAGVDGVREVTPSAYGEVMMASSTNVVVNVVVKGMTDDALAHSDQLRGRVDPGKVRWLTHPEELLSDRFRFPLGIGAAPPTPGGTPTGTPTLVPADDAPGDAGANPFAASGALGDARVEPGVFLGVELARSLNLDVGSELQMISPDGDVGPTGLRPKLKSFRVAGIFTTGMYEYDQKLAYLAVEDAQRFFNLGDQLNRVELQLSDADQTDAVLARIRDVLSRRPGPPLEALGWKERNKNLFSALEIERLAMFFILGLTMLVAALAIVSSLVMIVVQRQRDIALLKALGASNRGVVRTFLVIGGFIGAVATVTGVFMGVGAALAMDAFGVPLPHEYYIETVPVQVSAAEVVVVAVAAFGMCLAATIYPSWAASRLRPVEGLRHG